LSIFSKRKGEEGILKAIKRGVLTRRRQGFKLRVRSSSGRHGQREMERRTYLVFEKRKTRRKVHIWGTYVSGK